MKNTATQRFDKQIESTLVCTRERDVIPGGYSGYDVSGYDVSPGMTSPGMTGMTGAPSIRKRASVFQSSLATKLRT